MSPYLKGGGDSARRANRIRYFATRPGVEVLSDGGSQPATKKQKAYIQRLLRAFPDARELLEYEDYLKNQTQESASEFIRQAREDFAVPMSQRENYLDYVSHRPGVELRGEHGLWTSGGKVENLAEAVREVAEHPGNVWTPVVAIRRQDAERLGYDNAENWRALVNASLCDIAKGYKIHPDHLRWYAAFHEKEKSVHIHTCCCIAVQDPLYLSPLTTCNRNVETLVQRHSCLRSEDTLQRLLEKVNRVPLHEDFHFRVTNGQRAEVKRVCTAKEYL